MEESKPASMKEAAGGLADDIERSLMDMHAGMRAGDQAAIDTASLNLEVHIRALRVMTGTLSDPEPPPLPPIVGPAPAPPPDVAEQPPLPLLPDAPHVVAAAKAQDAADVAQDKADAASPKMRVAAQAAADVAQDKADVAQDKSDAKEALQPSGQPPLV
jgi:hypothetical protein